MLHPVLRRLARDQWVRLHGTPRVTVLVGGPRGRAIWSQWLALSGMVGTLLEAGVAALEEPGAVDGRDAVDDRIRAAVARAVAEPAHPIAVLITAEAAQRWRAGRRDRLAALVDEGWIAVPEEVSEKEIDERRPPPPGSGDPPIPGGGIAGEARGGRDRGSRGDVDGPLDGALDGRSGGEADGRGGDVGGAPDRGFHVDARSLAEATLIEALEATPATAGRFRLNESLAVRFGPLAAEVDLLSRGDRIAIEIDGVHHFTDPECYRRDRRKDLLLQTQGFVVVRLLAEDVVRDVRAAVTAVSQALAYRLGEGRG